MKEYNNLTNYKQEDFLEYEIMKYLHKVSQTTTRTQLAKYLVENVDSIPKDALNWKKSRKTGRFYQPFMKRLSFALTSLYKAGLIDHPKRGITVLSKAGQSINPNDEKHIHELVIQAWKKTV